MKTFKIFMTDPSIVLLIIFMSVWIVALIIGLAHASGEPSWVDQTLEYAETCEPNCDWISWSEMIEPMLIEMGMAIADAATIQQGIYNAGWQLKDWEG